MLRLETLMERLLAEHDFLEEAKEAFVAALDDVRGQGYVALKSIAAYRTGLTVREWTDEEAEASLREFQVPPRGSARLAHKPLLDTLLHAAFAEAARQEIRSSSTSATVTPIPTSCSATRCTCAPSSRSRSTAACPWCCCTSATRTPARAGTSPPSTRMYLDLSYGIPLLGFGEMLSFTRDALGVAPISKLLYSSDGIGVPELHWMRPRTGGTSSAWHWRSWWRTTS